MKNGDKILVCSPGSCYHGQRGIIEDTYADEIDMYEVRLDSGEEVAFFNYELIYAIGPMPEKEKA